MAEDDKKTDDVIDPDALSDEDFLKLDVPPAEVVDPNAEENDNANASTDADKAAADLAAATAGGGDGTESTGAGDGEGGEEGAGTEGEGGDEGSGGEAQTGDDLTDEEKAAAEGGSAKETSANADKETLTLKDKEGSETPEEKKAKEDELAATEAAENQAVSDDFFKKVSAPFKADGKDVQVRTPEEAVRLMQMGVNYSKRMKEMKPLRAMNAMSSMIRRNSMNSSTCRRVGRRLFRSS